MPENPFDRYKEIGARDLMYREKAKVKPKSSVLDGLRDKKKDDGKAKSPDDMVQTPYMRKESDPPQYMKRSAAPGHMQKDADGLIRLRRPMDGRFEADK